jgi:Smg protein
MPEFNAPMIDILVYLFENYFDFSLHPKPDALARKLNAAGFEKDEVSEAIDWLSGLKDARIVEFTGDRRSLRIYTAEEQQKLDSGCLGFMRFLESAQVITPALRELIVERALMLKDFPVTLGKFKIIVLMVLWSREQDLEPLIVEELLYDEDPELAH